MTAPIIQVRDPLQENLQFAMQLFLQGRARRDAKAREAFSLIPEGMTAGEVAKDEQLTRVLKRGFGIDPSKLDAKTVLKPVTTAGAAGRTAAAGERAVGKVPGLQESLGATLLATQAGRPAGGITTPMGLEAEAQAGEATALRDRAIQLGAGQAVEKLRLKDPEGFQQFSLGQVVEALPSEVAARAWSGTLKFNAAKLGVEVATDKKNPINKILAPLGISAGDAVGAVAAGIDGLLTSALSIKASVTESEQKKSELLEAAEIRVAEGVANAFGGRVPVRLILDIMQGGESADTDIGREIIKFMAVGITENMTKRVMAGDPDMAAMIQALPFMRQFKDDPDVAIQLLGLALRRAYRNAGVELGEILPILEKKKGILRHVWDALVGSRPEIRSVPRRQPPPEEPSAGLGRTGGAAPADVTGAVGAFREQGTGLQLSEAEKQSLAAFMAAIQGILQQPQPGAAEKALQPPGAR